MVLGIIIYDSIKTEVVNPKTLNLPFGDGYDHPSMVIVVMVNLIGFTTLHLLISYATWFMGDYGIMVHHIGMPMEKNQYHWMGYGVFFMA